MKANFNNFINIVLTNSNGNRKNCVLFDYANNKSVNQRIFQNEKLVKTIHENGFTNYSQETGRPLLSFVRDSSKKISHVFSEKTGKLKHIVKKDYLNDSGYYANFDKDGLLRSVTILKTDKNDFKSKYYLNKNGDVIKIKRKKPEWDGELAIKYNSTTDEVEFIQKDQRFFLNSFVLKEENHYNDDFGKKLVKKVTKYFNCDGSVDKEITKFAQKDNKTYKYEYIGSSNTSLSPNVYQSFDKNGSMIFWWIKERFNKSPKLPYSVFLNNKFLDNFPINISKFVQKDYFEFISGKHFLRNLINSTNKNM